MLVPPEDMYRLAIGINENRHLDADQRRLRKNARGRIQRGGVPRLQQGAAFIVMVLLPLGELLGSESRSFDISTQ